MALVPEETHLGIQGPGEVVGRFVEAATVQFNRMARLKLKYFTIYINFINKI